MRPDDWNAHKIANKCLSHRIGTPIRANLQEEALVEASADALIAAGYRPVNNRERMVDILEELAGLPNDTMIGNADFVIGRLLEGDKE